MKILIIYYTGTYNTRFIAKSIKESFIENDFLVDLLEVNAFSKPCSLDDYDFVFFGYPIYAFNAPKLFQTYIKKLKIIPEQNYLIFKTSGETLKLNNASSRLIRKVIKKGHGKLNQEYHFVMPYNIVFKYNESFVNQILAYNKKLVEILTFDVLKNVKREIHYTFLDYSVSKLLTIQRFGAFLNSYFYKVDKTKCNQCQLCVKSCPVNNISLINDEIKFSNRCMMCMRCSFYCPQEAIKIGLLDKWRVIGPYDLSTPKEDHEPYINNNSKGFYKCFIKTFQEIDERYQEIKSTKSSDQD
ncbi:MAG TPA: EFR1 family ferrodoxin [Candidatus Onthovivens sp.]|nr:EFR1 family ferrodoxin [Candidatus Onthovivens sp.]